MSILPKICSRMFDRLEKSLVNIKFISISTNIDSQSYLLQPFQLNLINFSSQFLIPIFFQNPPLSWRTIWMVLPASMLQLAIVSSSLSYFPPKMSLICSISIPSFSWRAYLTCRIVFSGSKLNCCFLPVKVLIISYIFVFYKLFEKLIIYITN